MKNILLEMKNVNKTFPGVYALRSVNFELEDGEVHALLGENGAGKSTLIKILGGIYSIDEGEIYIHGKKAEIKSVKDAQNYGISIIHQELVLVPHMTVAEQQMVEIIKAVSFNSKILVMDEPTSSLTEKEVQFLFETIRNLKK